MNGIDAFDAAVSYHFRFSAEKSRQIVSFMEVGYYVGSYGAIGVLVLLCVTLFLWQGKRRSALVAIGSFAGALALIQAVRYFVPRRRPDDAHRWLGPENMIGSYPSSAVFLFMLAMIFLGFAIWTFACKPWQRVLYVGVATALTVWVCMSQFYLSTHFLTDILGGIAGATVVSWLAYRWLDPTSDQPSAPGL